MRRIGRGLIVRRTHMVAAHDVAMAGASFALALLLRYGLGSFWELSSGFIVEGMLLFAAVSALVFWRMRIYRGVWRYTGLRDVVLVVQAVSLAVLLFVPILFVLTRLEGYPRSAFLINWFILIALLVGPRVVYRAVRDGSLAGVLRRGGSATGRIPVLLLGVGDNAELFISATTRGSSSNYRVVGIVDDDASQARRHIHGIRILGTTAELPEIVRALRARGAGPQRAVLTEPNPDPDRLACLARGLRGDRSAALPPAGADRSSPWRRARHRCAADPPRRPARPPAGRAGPRRHAHPGQRPAGLHHRRRRYDRCRAGAADRR